MSGPDRAYGSIFRTCVASNEKSAMITVLNVSAQEILSYAVLKTTGINSNEIY